MLKTPEQYFTELNFDPPGMEEKSHSLNSGERVFVEKYLGMDMLPQTPDARLEPQPQPQIRREAPKPRPVLEPRIEIAPVRLEIAAPPAVAPSIEIAPEKPEEKIEIQVAPAAEAAPAREAEQQKIETPAKDIPQEAVAAIAEDAPAGSPPVVAKESTAAVALADEIAEEAAPAAEMAAAPEKIEAAAPRLDTAAPAVQAAAILRPVETPATKMVTMRDLASVETSIRMVSFYVENQLFLLPVTGIHEVLRHMELIKVPQAPSFVAGAINLRGNVMPLIHLSALLTNRQSYTYNEKSFIIVYGSDNMRLGLIIDKINSMHMLDTEKIIWNVESRLGDAGDFLCAIANLDERVCGILAPEMITQKLLSS